MAYKVNENAHKLSYNPEPATLPSLIRQSIAVDTKLEEFLDSLENYAEESHSSMIGLFYTEQVECSTNLAAKVNSWCWYITKLDNEAEYYREQAKRFSKIASIAENKSKSMKGFLKLTIESQGGKLPTEHFPKLHVQKTKATLVINDNYQGSVPDGLLKQLPLSEVLDKAKVREMIDNGNQLAFAELQEGGKALYGLK